MPSSTANPHDLLSPEPRTERTPVPADPERRMGGVLEPLRRLWWLVLLGAALGLALGFLARSSGENGFQASATVYLGQPVGTNGALLDTISSKASTGIQLGTGDEALAKAAAASGVSQARIRRGLTVAAVSSPLASKLATPPAIMKVTVRNQNRAVAQDATAAIAKHLVDETGVFAKERIANLESKVTSQEALLKGLTSRRDRAISGGDNDETLGLLLISSISATESSLADAREELAISRELEQSRVIDAPKVARVTSSERGSSLVVATLLGALLGAAAALVLGRRQPAG